MLIINNGVPKSGSTWVQRILEQGLNPAYPSQKWRNDWKNPSVEPADLKAYVQSEEWKDQPTVIKMHITHEKKYDFLLRDDIKIIVSYRNIPDSVVSWFHHQIRHKKATLARREPWFKTKGRQFAMRTVAHRMSWSDKPDVIPVCYEDLVANAHDEIARIFQALGLEQPTEEYARIAQATQVTLKDDSPLREGMHVRTAGRSVAHEELSEPLFREFTELYRSLPDFRVFQPPAPQGSQTV